LLAIYAVHRREPVFLLGQVVGLFVYSRNLMLVLGRGEALVAATPTSADVGVGLR
jgi:lipid-A-disaccharide synthase-like uncharacterized protein